jgi:glycerophosphoryl diester phosphodiesterase
MVDLNYNMLSREIIAELQHRGLTVWCWTVNDPVVMEALMRWGVDSITTDRVDVLVDLRRQLMQK